MFAGSFCTFRVDEYCSVNKVRDIHSTHGIYKVHVAIFESGLIKTVGKKKLII